MKNFIFLIFIFFCFSYASAQTKGALTVSTTTSATSSPGRFGNLDVNVTAIWIENESGNFIKSLFVSGTKRTKKLLTWYSSAVRNTVDAVTCATEIGYGLHTCSWNGTDTMGVQVPDGIYKVKMELTDNNITYVTPNLFSATFTKGAEIYISTPPDVPSFSSTTISWAPVGSTGLNLIDDISNRYSIYPNPTKSSIFVSGLNVQQVEIFSLNNKSILKSNQQKINLEALIPGVYLAHIKTANGTFVKRIIKK